MQKILVDYKSVCLDYKSNIVIVPPRSKKYLNINNFNSPSMLSKFSFVKEAKYLGITIDSNLDFKYHIK